MSYQVKFTDTAKDDLRNIAIYIAEQSKDKTLAMNFVNELREKTKILASFPEIGSLPNDKVMKSMGYRFLVHKEYLLFYYYDAKQETSYILAVFHSRRDYTRVMRRFLK